VKLIDIILRRDAAYARYNGVSRKPTFRCADCGYTAGWIRTWFHYMWGHTGKER
jgi:hypothetical protein